MSAEQFQSFLHDYFSEVRGRNPHFSLRALAKRIKISPGSLSEVLQGKRRISLEKMHQIFDELSVPPDERARILSGEGKQNKEALRLGADQFRLIADYKHWVLLALFRTVDFDAGDKWLSERLSLTTTLVQEMLKRLERLGLISRKGKSLFRVQKQVRSSDGVPTAAIRESHRQTMALAEKSLEEVDTALRDFSFTTLAFDMKDLPKARELIRKFHEEFSRELPSKKPREVYRLSVQLFPLTKVREE